MPELPEVETIRRQLEQEIRGYTITAVSTNWEKSFRPSFKIVRSAIVGRRIGKVDRQAKLIIFELGALRIPDLNPSDPGSGPPPRQVYLLFHLKLTGRLLVRSPQDPPDDYTRSVFRLVLQPVGLNSTRRVSSIKELRFADARKFGFVKLVKDEKEMEVLLKGYGPEPFKDLTPEKFRKVLAGSSRPIKLVLLDQEKISGLGNIYANDALWLAKIHPRVSSNRVTKGQSKKLYEAVLEVLRRGLKYGGASDQWYRQVHGEEGEYQKHFLVYGRTGERCLRCQSEIRRIEIGGRGTFICPNCQKV